MKTKKRLAEQKQYSRNDILIIIQYLTVECGVEAFSRLMDVMEDLGFERGEDPV